MSTISAENLQLVRSFQQGDQAAAERLLSVNAPMVRGMARKALPPAGGLEFDDVLIEGQLGLLAAAERFDLSRGFAFITYAKWRVAQAIGRVVEKESRLIHIPADVAAQSRRKGTTGELPCVALSLDQPLREGEDAFGDLLPALGDVAGQVEAQVIASQALAALDDRERLVIVRRFGLGGRPEETLAEVGEALNMTREGVRKMELRAMGKMRQSLGVAS